MVEEPGTVFKFNDGAVQLLSYTFNKATGQDIDQYATKYLFEPLGIEHYWRRTPTGHPDTEGGLYLAPKDVARLGYLMLKGGVWQGKRIVSSEWWRLL